MANFLAVICIIGHCVCVYYGIMYMIVMQVVLRTQFKYRDKISCPKLYFPSTI